MQKLFLTLLAIISFSSLANQTPVSPDQVIQQTGTKLFSRIAASQQELKKFPELMRDIVEEELMPAIDYKYASYKILGKHLKKNLARTARKVCRVDALLFNKNLCECTKPV